MQADNRIYIPTITFVRIALALLIASLIVKLAPLLMLVLIALILAVAAQPVLSWSELRFKNRFARQATITIIGLFALGLIVFTVLEVIPPLTNQISIVISRLPEYLHRHLDRIENGPQILKAIVGHLQSHSGAWFNSVLDAGQMAFEGLTSLVLVYVLFLYLMVDGPRAYSWLVSFFSPENQVKIEKTSDEVSKVVSAYILGQLVTSAFAATYVFIALKILSVPAALMLAVLAAVFDALPVVGFFLSLFPAVLFAATVSAKTAVIVVGLYILYHALESYLISPWVYGKHMRMSGLVVLLAFVAGSLIGGLPGALVILPIVASYPIIEKIWLKTEHSSRKLPS